MSVSDPDRQVLDAALAWRRDGHSVVLFTVARTWGSSPRSAGSLEPFHYDTVLLRKVFGPAWRLVIIGAGQLSRYVAEFAQPLGYEVIVCDPRPEYAKGFDVRGVSIETGMPDDVVRASVTDSRSAVMALTHDPRLDDMALMEALESEAFYVGAIGSMGNQRKRRLRLAELGVERDRLDALHGPIGLPIGSRTPAEIAVAVVAELVASRHGIRLQRRKPEVEAGNDGSNAIALSARAG